MDIKTFKVTDVIAAPMLNTFLAMHRKKRRWLEFEPDPIDLPDPPLPGRNYYKIVPEFRFELEGMGAPRAQDYWHFQMLTLWLGDGPKVFAPSEEQCKALENVDVNLPVTDYSQPFETLLVLVNVPPFEGVLCHHWPERRCATFTCLSADAKESITTTIFGEAEHMEASLKRYDPDVGQDISAACLVALRVAINSCLALTNYPHITTYLFPHDAERDRRLAREPGEKGQRAKKRIALAVQRVAFEQEVKLHHTTGAWREAVMETGRTMPVHWRRGHWRMQPWGPKQCFRRRTFIKPVMVHADLFVGDKSNTLATYRG